MNSFFVILTIFLQAPQLQTRQELTVTASMVPLEFSNLARNLTVLNLEDIQASGASSIQELLQMAGVHVQERGASGIQADISIRGASFEQTLILMDGVKMSDPQTGHHLLNLPISLDQIEKIEILRGPGARIYGPNAFGGVINIITRPSRESTSVTLGYGENKYMSASIQSGIRKGPAFFQANYQNRSSDGYIENTDFDHQNMSFVMDLDFETHFYQIMFGQDHKDFGANRFYHPDFPDQREDTRADFLKMNGRWIAGSFTVSSNAYARKHQDEFLLDYQRPDWYKNTHETHVIGVDIKANRTNNLGVLSLGAEHIEDRIDSSNLGNHDRTKTGFFLEQQFHGERWESLAGVSAYSFSEHGWEWWPGLDIAWKPNVTSKFFLSGGRSFRLPTFTELYYVGGGNVGNPNLNAEKAWNYESGYGWKTAGFEVQASWFARNSEEMIDWVWNEANRTYYAENFSKMKTQGLELEFIHSPQPNRAGLKNVRLFYSFLHSSLDTAEAQTKYLLNHPEQLGSLTARFEAGQHFQHSYVLRHEQGENLEERTILDGQCRYLFKKTEITLSVDNLNDKKVEDVNRVALPGRWIRFSMGYRFKR